MSKVTRSRRKRAPKSRSVAIRHQIEFQRVLLAVYFYSEDDKAISFVTNTFLSRELGLSVAAVRRAIEEMQRRKIIKSYDWKDGICCRVHVLMDHPRSRAAVKQLNRYRDRGPRRG